MDDSLLFELLVTNKPEEKAAIIAESIFSTLSAETSLIARRCSILHWFDEAIVEALLKDIPNAENRVRSIYAQITSLPFVESLPWGLTFNSLTREGLLYRYTSTQPELLRIATRLAAPAYRVHEEDRKIIAEAFFCYVVGGEITLALELLDELVQGAVAHEDQEYVSGLLELAYEAQSFPFVSPLPLAKILASHHFNLEPSSIENPVTYRAMEIQTPQRSSSLLAGGLLQSDIVISTSRLTKTFGKLVAVNDLHLEVIRGDIFGFLGPNGSGKTTTIRMLLGLIRPTAGRVVIFGMDNAYQLPAILKRVGAIVETPVFYPFLSGKDNLHIVAAASGMKSGKANRRRIDELLELVELRTQAKMAYRKYSLGMKQRLGIAAALLTDPELIMLDEPTNGLDPSGMFEIRQLIQRLAELGKTIFLSSHLLNEVQQVCNRVAILQRGNLIKQGDVSELLRGNEQVLVRLNAPEETQVALATLREARERGADWIGSIVVEPNRQGQPTLRIDAPKVRSAEINALLAHNNLFAVELHPYEGNLEEIFLQLTNPSISPGMHIGMAGLAGDVSMQQANPLYLPVSDGKERSQ